MSPSWSLKAEAAKNFYLETSPSATRGEVVTLEGFSYDLANSETA
jgi:hypothetical protein